MAIPQHCPESQASKFLQPYYSGNVSKRQHNYHRTWEFVVHKDFSCYYSKMLEKAFNGHFIERQTQSITLEDFDYLAAFGAVQAWMYTQKLYIEALKKRWITQDDDWLYFSWVLADLFIIPEPQNETMKAIFTGKLPYCLKRWIFKNISPKSKLRKYCVEKAVRLVLACRDTNQEEFEDAPFQLSVDVVRTARDKRLLKDGLKVDDYLVRVHYQNLEEPSNSGDWRAMAIVSADLGLWRRKRTIGPTSLSFVEGWTIQEQQWTIISSVIPLDELFSNPEQKKAIQIS